MKRGSGCYTVDIYCTAALTSFSDSISYITYLFSECGIFTLISEKKYFDKLVQRIRVKIALNVVKASKLVQMKLIT